MQGEVSGVLVANVVNYRIQDMALLTEGGSGSGLASINIALLTEGVNPN